MKWLEYLEKNNISFNIHILEIDDYFIFHKKFHRKELLIVLKGLLKLINIFTNGEVICTKLLCKYNLIPWNFVNMTAYKKSNNYYTAKAIVKTIVLAVPLNQLKLYRKQKNNQSKDFFCLLNFMDLVQQKNNVMVDILCHRNTKKRITHLLLILAKRFGYINKKQIVIPFYISHNTIGLITGSQRANVTRIMNHLKKEQIISYKQKNIVIHNLLKLIQQ